ncbi:hypothetical protein F5148DRAFT_1162812 [Russula earlei]|uniref:Uncharacterized protein n=1 Tax=Russula earlei TaxID=71964 RepID=A0ACC0UMC1_9AGAM|nr:hypothetical protein F5148DRAFT_1162812 [Russula earlei]
MFKPISLITSLPKVGKVRWEDPPMDPRPPWVYSTSAGLRLILIPSILFYAVFFADFGDREHVFMPPRRWLQRQREAFFTMTPEERKLVEESMSGRTREEMLKQDRSASSER